MNYAGITGQKLRSRDTACYMHNCVSMAFSESSLLAFSLTLHEA